MKSSIPYVFVNASHAARCTARHGVGSHALPPAMSRSKRWMRSHGYQRQHRPSARVAPRRGSISESLGSAAYRG
jgi:hypothetical protein